MGILRFLLAITVLIGHTGPSSLNILGNYGALAVDTFFIISGFYMSLIVEKYKLQTMNFENVKNFYFSRGLRIYSIYFLCMFITFALCHFGIMGVEHWPRDTLTELNKFSDKLAYVSENIFIFGQDWMRFFVFNGKQFIFDPLNQAGAGSHQVGSGYAVLGQAWSLATELTFYLLVPFILTRSKKFIFGLCLLSFVIRYYLFTIYNMYLNVFFPMYLDVFFPVALGLFLLGTLSHRFIYNRISQKLNLGSKLISIGLIVTLITMLFWLYPNFLVSKGVVSYFWTRWWAFLVVTVLTVPFLFLYCKNSKVDRYIGELSFPIYMTHFFCISIVARYTSVNNVYYVIMLSAVISILIMHLVALPLDNYRHRRFLAKQQSKLPDASGSLVLQS